MCEGGGGEVVLNPLKKRVNRGSKVITAHFLGGVLRSILFIFIM